MAHRTPREIVRSIAANVARERRRRGLSQEQLAEEAGLNVRAIQRVERAVVNYGVVVLVRVAEALGVSTARLVQPAKLGRGLPGRPPKKRQTRRG